MFMLSSVLLSFLSKHALVVFNKAQQTSKGQESQLSTVNKICPVYRAVLVPTYNLCPTWPPFLGLPQPTGSSSCCTGVISPSALGFFTWVVMTCCFEKTNSNVEGHNSSRHLLQKRCVSSGMLVPLEHRGSTTLGTEDRSREGLLLWSFTSWVKSRKAAERNLGNKAQCWRHWRRGGRRIRAVKLLQAPARITHTSAPHVVRWNLNLAQGLVCPCKSLFNFYVISERNWLITERDCPCSIAGF